MKTNTIAATALVVSIIPLSTQLLRNTLDPIRTRVETTRTEPVIQTAVPNHDLGLGKATINVQGVAKRHRGPCTDTRKTFGTVTLHVVMPRQSVTDGTTITVDATKIVTIIEPDLRTISNDGTCSRLAHLIARPTSSPGLNRKAEQAALQSAGNCVTKAIIMIGGLKKAVTDSLTSWGINRPIIIKGALPSGTCLSDNIQTNTQVTIPNGR